MTILYKIINAFPGHLSNIPADYIDQIYLRESRGWFARLKEFIQLRMVYLLLFLPAVLVDTVSSFFASIFFACRTLFTSDEAQDESLVEQKEYASIFSKCLYSMVCSLLGLLNPKLIAFYFISKHKKYIGVKAGGDFYHSEKAKLIKPKSIKELANKIKEANQKDYKMIPVGAGHSQGKQFLPPESSSKSFVVDLSEFNTISIDPEAKTAIVGAGTKWSDIQLQANNHKLSLDVMQASNVFSVGGSIGTNIHGWAHRMGMLSNTIIEMEVITPTGDIKKVTPKDRLFHQITGGLGLFGMVTKVKLKLTDNEVLRETGIKIAPKDYVEYFQKQVRDDDDTRMHLYRLSLDPNNLLGEGVCVNYKRVIKTDPVKTKHLSTGSSTGSRFNIVILNIMRRIGLLRKFYWKYESSRILANKEAPLTRNEIMQPPINAMFNSSVSESEWLQEYFLPGAQLSAFLEELKQLLMDNHVVLLNASVRFVKKNDISPMSYVQNEDKFAVVLCFNQSLKPNEVIKAQKWLRKAQHMAVEKGGTFYLPYQHVSKPEDLAKSYPQIEKAIQEKKKIDPNNVFASGFAKKYMSDNPKPTNHFKVVMQNKKIFDKFAGFLNVVLKRVDSDALYILLKDILEYKDTHEEIYTELCQRLPEIKPDVISDIRNQLKSLGAIQNDLAKQAQTILPRGFKNIDGMVEIGYPGRFISGFKNKYKITGNIVAMTESRPGILSYLESGFPASYNKSELLDYAKPNLKKLPNNSAEVITCYVGLHHFPKSELGRFLKDVVRVLKPGGHFLLVDHDCDNELTLSMAHMAHSIFNAVNGVSVSEELNEIRNFRSMEYWQSELKKAGLASDMIGANVPMIREKDSSRNRMVSFIKPIPQNQLLQRLGNSVKNKNLKKNKPKGLGTNKNYVSNLFDKPKLTEEVRAVPLKILSKN